MNKENVKLITIAVVIAVIVNLVIGQVLVKVHDKAVPSSANYDLTQSDIIDPVDKMSDSTDSTNQKKLDILNEIASNLNRSNDEKTRQQFESAYNDLANEINNAIELRGVANLKPLSRLGAGGGSCSTVYQALMNINESLRNIAISLDDLNNRLAYLYSIPYTPQVQLQINQVHSDMNWFLNRRYELNSLYRDLLGYYNNFCSGIGSDN